MKICQCHEAINLNHSAYRHPDEYPAWDQSLCHICNYWEGQIADPIGRVVIDRVHYRIGPDNQSSKWFKGFGGQKFVVHILDPSEYVTTTDLWYQGPIPPRFRDRLPDNAEFHDPDAPIPTHQVDEVDDGSELRQNKKDIGR